MRCSGATERAGILKDGSVPVGADHEEGVERRGGRERRVRREFHARLADQSGGKRESRVIAATTTAVVVAAVSDRAPRALLSRRYSATARVSVPARVICGIGQPPG